MTRKNDISPAAPATCRAWSAPRLRRLATSSATLAGATNPDLEGFS